MKTLYLLIASNDEQYNCNLKRALEAILPIDRIDVIAWTGCFANNIPAVAESSDCLRLCIGHTQIHHQLQSDMNPAIRALVNGSVQFIPFRQSEYEQSEHELSETATTLEWPAPVSTVLTLLEQFFPEAWFKTNSVFIQTKELASSSYECADKSEETSICSMHLSFHDPNRRWLLHQMRLELARGRQVYYLPLMASYQMQLTIEPDRCGPSLSDLMLAIHQECAPAAANLGSYMQMHPSGYLQFRPPDRSDDILCCDPEVLRQLVHLLRTRTDEQNGDAIAWIDCFGLPMSTAVRIGVLCDKLAIDLPQSGEYFAREARRELGLLLARLPAGCSIVEVSEGLLT